MPARPPSSAPAVFHLFALPPAQWPRHCPCSAPSPCASASLYFSILRHCVCAPQPLLSRCAEPPASELPPQLERLCVAHLQPSSAHRPPCLPCLFLPFSVFYPLFISFLQALHLPHSFFPFLICSECEVPWGTVQHGQAGTAQWCSALVGRRQRTTISQLWPCASKSGTSTARMAACAWFAGARPAQRAPGGAQRPPWHQQPALHAAKRAAARAAAQSGGGDAAAPPPPPLAGPSVPPVLSSQAVLMAASSSPPEEPAAAVGEAAELGKLGGWAQRYKQQQLVRGGARRAGGQVKRAALLGACAYNALPPPAWLSPLRTAGSRQRCSQKRPGGQQARRGGQQRQAAALPAATDDAVQGQAAH